MVDTRHINLADSLGYVVGDSMRGLERIAAIVQGSSLALGPSLAFRNEAHDLSRNFWVGHPPKKKSNKRAKTKAARKQRIKGNKK
jgi:hypothetical protein